MKKSNILKLLGTTLLLSSCSMIFNLPSTQENTNSVNGNTNNNNNGNSSLIKLTVYDGNVMSTYFVKDGQDLKINEYTKEGYGCKGIFDSPEGGNQYFYSDGSAVSVWDESNPTNLYVQWESLNNIVEKKTYHDSYDFSYYKGINFTPKSTSIVSNAIKSNKDKILSVNLSFYAYEDSGEDWVVYFKHSNTYNEGSLLASQIASKYFGILIEPPTSMKKYSMSNIFTCRDVNQLGLYLWVTRGATWGKGVISDFEITYSFN